MTSVNDHYENLLAEVYSWMYGGFEAAAQRNRDFFARHEINPKGSRIALDLGAGSGFQSIPLAELGFQVTALDLSRELLDELRKHAGALEIKTIQDDILNLTTHCPEPAELIICMTDTLNHLPSRENVRDLFRGIAQSLEVGGRFITTFRDLGRPLEDLNRFIPVREDENTIFTCFLEYESETVKVHDLVHRRGADGWKLYKSFYRKLILAPDAVQQDLRDCGLAVEHASVENGLVTIIAGKE